MTGELFTLSGLVRFLGKVKGTRSELENNAETMLLDVAMYAKEKYPEYTWDSSRVCLWQKVRGLMKI